MISIGTLHHISAWSALALGALVVALPKGTRMHRVVGNAYVYSMLALNVTALSIYDLFDGFGPFHGAALVSSATIIAGFLPVILRKPARRWRETHAYFMAWSYVGLWAAAVSEISTRTPWIRGLIVEEFASRSSPGLVFGTTVAIATMSAFAIGAWAVRRWVPRALAHPAATSRIGASPMDRPRLER